MPLSLSLPNIYISFLLYPDYDHAWQPQHIAASWLKLKLPFCCDSRPCCGHRSRGCLPHVAQQIGHGCDAPGHGLEGEVQEKAIRWHMESQGFVGLVWGSSRQPWKDLLHRC